MRAYPNDPIRFFKDPISKQSHPEVLKLGLQHIDFGGAQFNMSWKTRKARKTVTTKMRLRTHDN